MKLSRTTRSFFRTMSTLPTHNQYFQVGGKDIWSFINETATAKAAKSGDGVANLGQGFFSYSPPQFAIDSAKEAFEVAADNQYAPAQGKPVLIESLVKHYSGELGYQLSKDQVLVTTGANEGMFAAFFGLLNRGDEVIVFEPFFDQYIPNIEMAGGVVKYVKLHAPKDFDTRIVDANEYYIDWEELENAITSKTKMVVLNTPHNPIGKVFSKEELTRIGNLAIKHNFVILSDEVYENLYFNIDSFPRIASFEDEELRRRVLFVGSAGKSFAATGWRIGWVIGSLELMPYVRAAHTRICFSSPAPIQVAVSKSIEIADSGDYFSQMREEYAVKYQILENAFKELQIPYTRADGGYFLLVNFKKVKLPDSYKWPDSIEGKPRDFKLAYFLIEEFGVVAIPPTEFYRSGELELQDCLRFAVCKDDRVLQDAARRLKGLAQYL